MKNPPSVFGPNRRLRWLLAALAVVAAVSVATTPKAQTLALSWYSYIENVGTEPALPQRPILRFGTGLLATDNPATASTDITATGTTLTQGNGINISGGVVSVATTLPDNYTFSASGTAVTVTNNETIGGTLTCSTHTAAGGAALVLTGNNSGTKLISTAGTGVDVDGFGGVNFKLNGTTKMDVGVSNANKVTVASGVTLEGAAALSVLSGGANTLTLDTGGAAAMNVCNTNCNSLNLAKAGVPTVVTGRLSPGQDMRWTGVVSPSSISTQQDNYAPAGASTGTIIRQAIGAAVTITGLSISQNSGTIITLCNIDTTNSITVSHDSASSTAGNRFFLPGSANQTIGVNTCKMYWYDNTSSRWRAMN